MGVILREKISEKGTRSLYLDIHSGGRRHKEYLGIYLKPAKNDIERDLNKYNRELAEGIRAMRELELNSEKHNIAPDLKRKDFVSYFNDFASGYGKRDLRTVKSSFNWFVKYLQTKKIKSISPSRLNKNLSRGFLDFLKSHLKGDTPLNYFNKYKMVIRQAVRDNLMIHNPAEGISLPGKKVFNKELLSLREISVLAKASSPNREVKRAFLFSLFTGMRWCDIKSLTYDCVDFQEGLLRFKKAGTGRISGDSVVDIRLSPMLLKLIGGPGQGNKEIFKLPGYAGTMKALHKWVIHAGINKNITWLCGRYSFTANQVAILGTDVATVASLLGYKSLRQLEIFRSGIEEKKAEAISRQPEVDFSL